MSKYNLVLVDGDSKQLRVLTTALRNIDISAGTFLSGEDCLVALEIELPDAVFVAKELNSGIDGYALCRTIKASSKFAGVPLILMTKDGSLEGKIDGLKQGFDDVMTKPVHAKELALRVELLLEKKRYADLEREASAVKRIVGDIRDTGVVELIQSVGAGKKSGFVVFENNNEKGSLDFRDGALVDAECGDLKGEEAVYRLMLWERGKYELRFRPIRKDAVIIVGLDDMLLEGTRRVDEWADLRAQLPPFDSVLEIVYDELFEKLAELPDDLNRLLRHFDGTRSIWNVLDLVGNNSIETVSKMSSLYDEGLLKNAEAQRDQKASVNAKENSDVGISSEPIKSEQSTGKTRTEKLDDTVDIDESIDRLSVETLRAPLENGGISSSSSVSVPVAAFAEVKPNGKGRRANQHVVAGEHSRSRRSTASLGESVAGRRLGERGKTLPPPPPKPRLVAVDNSNPTLETIPEATPAPIGSADGLSSPLARVQLEKRKVKSIEIVEVDRRPVDKALNNVDSSQNAQSPHTSAADERSVVGMDGDTTAEGVALEDEALALLKKNMSLEEESSVGIKTANAGHAKAEGEGIVVPSVPLVAGMIGHLSTGASSEATSSANVDDDSQGEGVTSRATFAATTPTPMDDYVPRRSFGKLYVVLGCLTAAAIAWVSLNSGSADTEAKVAADEVQTKIALEPSIRDNEGVLAVEPSAVEAGKVHSAVETELDEHKAIAASPDTEGEQPSVAASALNPAEAQPTISEPTTTTTEATVKANAPKTVKRVALKKGDDFSGLVKKAQKARRAKKRMEAISLIDEALAIKKTNTALMTKAEILMDLGDAGSALKILNRVTKSSAGKSKGWLLKGKAHQKLGQRSDAQRAYARFLQLAPDSKTADSVRKTLATL